MWLSTDNGVDTLFTFNPIGLNGGTGLADSGGGSQSSRRTSRASRCTASPPHRLFYTVGGGQRMRRARRAQRQLTTANAGKDVYARVDYKFGGMGLDGDTTGVTLPPENWRESSPRRRSGLHGQRNRHRLSIHGRRGEQLQPAGHHLQARGRLWLSLSWGSERLRRGIHGRDTSTLRSDDRDEALHEELDLRLLVSAGRLRDRSAVAGLGALRATSSPGPSGSAHPGSQCSLSLPRLRQREGHDRVSPRLHELAKLRRSQRSCVAF